jgi:single-strand DNA-binding protein
MFTDVQIVGRLTRDPELNQTGNGTNVANFSIAVNRDFKNDEVDYFDVTAWKTLAELVTAHKKQGDLILVQGNLRQDRYEKDGQKRSKVYVVANRVVFLPSKNDDGWDKSESNNSGDDGDIPF